MCQHRWAEIRYKDLPAACLTKHAKSFEKHDAIRFRHFMDKVKEGKVKVNTGALQPHEIMKRAGADGGELAQGQWLAMLERLRTLGRLEDAVAVCDVSGSMSCEAAPGVSCMDVAISMSLLVAELSEARQIITFHERPSLVDLPDTEDLAELAGFVRRLPWGGSTNFHRVFDLLKAKPPKKVIVFSDMQFAAAGGNGPVLRQVQASYREAGLQMPELVFWNLRGSKGAPALATEQGVLLMSGFSSRMLKMVTEYGPDPLTAMCTALDNPLCRKVHVAHALEAELLAPSGRCFRPYKHFSKDSESPESPESTEPMASVAATKALKMPPKRLSVTRDLARLPCAMAEKALIGKAGLRIQRLRQTMDTRLCEDLDRGYFHFWLDVRESRLVATVETAGSSFTEQRIRDALEQLKHYVPEAVVYNNKSYKLAEGRGLSRACEVMVEIRKHTGASVLIGRKGLRLRLLEDELRSSIGPELQNCHLQLKVDSRQLTAVLEGCHPSQTSAELKKVLRKMKARFLESHWHVAVQNTQQHSSRRDWTRRAKSVPSRAEKARRQTGLAKVKKLRTEQVVVAQRRRAHLKAVKAEKSRIKPKTSKSERMELKKQPQEILDWEW